MATSRGKRLSEKRSWSSPSSCVASRSPTADGEPCFVDGEQANPAVNSDVEGAWSRCHIELAISTSFSLASLTMFHPALKKGSRLVIRSEIAYHSFRLLNPTILHNLINFTLFNILKQDFMNINNIAVVYFAEIFYGNSIPIQSVNPFSAYHQRYRRTSDY
ncbi:hypothetical protein OsI_24978 [Oryza sativa Indica Group]|uniref:Uncharacterized protein n=1 Tax=Oryza sativa subsp. indica TaxID=39946 RepID=A2YID7_ORYSI|nr:hypothetical protein OsI_24978 [Oryza sativa Indica Group]